MIENRPTSRMPAQRPGRSRQDWATPPEFLAAVRRRLGIEAFSVDLAASAENTVAEEFITAERDSLTVDWSQAIPRGTWGWLNPPFGHMLPWVEKAVVETAKYTHDIRIAMLVPAAVGANWWRDCVDRRARVLLLNGRLTFVGATGPYPKDCALLLYGAGRLLQPGYEVWSWRGQR